MSSLSRAIVAGAFFVLAVIVSQAQSKKAEGARPYTPTRLEWLAVDLQAHMHESITESGYSLDFIGLEAEDTILIYVRYLPNVNRQVMNISIETARDVIEIRARSHGWSRWLKVREDVKMGEDK